jgi:L-lysine 2,3-aminomutase/intein/homing endonuclease
MRKELMNNWNEILNQSVTTIKGLVEKFNIKEEEAKKLKNAFNIRINPYYASLIKYPGDPIWLQVVPDIKELEDNSGIEDPLGEEKQSPVPNITHRYPNRALFLVSSQCGIYCRFSLPKGTKILTAGLIEKNIEDIKIGDKIITHTGNIETVYETFNVKYKKDLVEIKTNTNLLLSITQEHPILAIKRKQITCNCGKKNTLCKPDNGQCKKRHPNRNTDFTPKFINAIDLEVGDFVATPKIKSLNNNKFNDINLAYLIGLYLAEGDIPVRKNGKRICTRFSFSHLEKETLAEELMKICKKLKLKAVKHDYSKRNYCSVQIYDTKLSEFLLEHCGRYSENKKLSSEIILNSTDEFLIHILKGCIDGDGHFRNNNKLYIEFNTCSYNLSRQIFLILTKLGCQPSIYEDKKNIGVGKKYDSIKNVITQKNIMYHIKSSNIKTLNVLYNTNEITKQHSFETKDFMFSEIKTKTLIPFEDITYDLSVTRDESYIANMISVHNCTRKRKVGNPEKISLKHLESAFEYLEQHTEIQDIILSGGDPLLLSDSMLEKILKRLRQIKHILVIRIGTKLPCVLPQRITPELVNMLKKYHPIYINTHFNHPWEITEESSRACNMLADAGIPLGCQTVLMKGVNDNAETMKELMMKLVSIRVKPYYIYQIDLVKGTKHFRTPIQKGLDIMRELRGHISGIAVPQFVVDLPNGGGKTPMLPEYLIDKKDNKYIFKNYKNEIFEYDDFIDS